MLQKTIGIYGDTSSYSPFNDDTLIVEVCNEHIACLVKNAKTENVSAFEFFKVELENNDWDEVFYELRINSGLLDKSYAATKIYYNLHENSFIPAYKFTEGNAQLFLSLVHGDHVKGSIYYDKLDNEHADFVNAYRVKSNLLDTVNSNFLNLKAEHIYTSILKSVFETGNKFVLLKVQFYHSYFIASVFRGNKLQLMQRFCYETPEDILYHLLNISQQYELVEPRLQLSGFFDLDSATYRLIEQNFSDIYLEETEPEEPMKQKLGNYPLHYFSPFFNLQA